MENNIPLWSLDSLYKDLQCSEYKKDFETLNNLIAEMNGILDNTTSSQNTDFDFNSFLNDFINKQNELVYLGKTISAYAYIIYSTDTTNTQYMNNLNAVDEISVKLNQLSVKFSTILFENNDKLPDFFSKNPDKVEYKYLLEKAIEEKAHQMSAAEEELASKLSHTGGNAWSLLQEQLISNLHDENGKTFNELRNDANDADPILRKQSWEKEVQLLSQNKIAFAAALNNLKGETCTLNKKRNWNQAIDRSLFSACLQKQTLDALIGAIEDSLPMWREYFKAKALLLRKAGTTASKTAGTPEHPGIAFYDLFAPVENPAAKDNSDSESLFSKKWEFSDAKDYILKEYYSFSKDMGDFATKAFEQNWIDAKVRAGKVGGAYDEDFPKGHQSRILSNFTGVFSDIITLAHELGHAYHFSCMKDKPALFYDYPMTLAETASTFAETIVKQDMLKQSTGFDRIKILDLDLTDTSQVLVDILCRFYFERAVFEQKQNNELNAEDFCKLMQQSQQKSYGDGLNNERTPDDSNYTERHDFMWAVKCHYYITDLDFYNFPYAFGQLFAAALYERSRKEGPAFAKTYSELLSNTGNMSCEDLCKIAGFDITTKDFWKSGIEMYKKEVEEFCSYVKSL